MRQRETEVDTATLLVRLARNRREVAQAQALRYRIFHQEMGATSSLKHRLLRRDVDRFDRVCDHLLVIAPRRRRLVPYISGAVVGTFRLMRREVALSHRGFYSAGEFDLAPIMARYARCLELGRSCVDPDYRSRAVIDRLWRAIAGYVVEHEVDMLFGCASLPGADPDAHAASLSYLQHFHGAASSCRPRALDHRYVDMARLPVGQIDPKRAWAALPPLLKGYLRLGAVIGDGAVIDRNFNTVDVCVMLPTEAIRTRYLDRYSRQPKGLALA
ncbi:MAG: GNAT family N-acyltransferase [Alphaproteobacteria bacterium]